MSPQPATERDLAIEIGRLCDQLGLLWHHCVQPYRCCGPRGFPDMIIVGSHGMIGAELKSADGETSPQQDEWIHRAWQARSVIHTWRPADLASGDIRMVLAAIA